MERVNLGIPQGNFVLLNAPNMKGERCIYLRYFVDGKYIKRSTDIWINEDYWDNERQEVKSRHKNAARLNNRLNILYEKIRTQMLDVKGEITYDILSELLVGKRQNTKVEEVEIKSKDFIEYAHTVNDFYYIIDVRQSLHSLCSVGMAGRGHRKVYVRALEQFFIFEAIAVVCASVKLHVPDITVLRRIIGGIDCNRPAVFESDFRFPE